ncbi:AraC-like DNA-binding protein [Bradyrhizobium sp. LB8.2]|uniref:AraC family transcriptional regulator n=1 Tax=unclassified Bradyrhizobium TaxID=2631580 RepID=UPI00339946BF
MNWGAQRGNDMGRSTALRRVRVDSIDQLREIVPGVRREIVQIGRGRLKGNVIQTRIGDLPLDFATINVGIRTRGSSDATRLMVGMLTHATDRVTRSSYQSQQKDVMLLPPGSEQENRFYGGASMLVIAPSLADVEKVFSAEPALCETAFGQRQQFKATPETARTIPKMRSLIAWLIEHNSALTEEAAAFWKRAIIEAMMANVLDGLPQRPDGPLLSALKTVRLAEEYLDAQGRRPVHVSELTVHLGISRRTLHRAFHDALGVGPIAFS